MGDLVTALPTRSGSSSARSGVALGARRRRPGSRRTAASRRRWRPATSITVAAVLPSFCSASRPSPRSSDGGRLVDVGVLPAGLARAPDAIGARLRVARRRAARPVDAGRRPTSAGLVRVDRRSPRTGRSDGTAGRGASSGRSLASRSARAPSFVGWQLHARERPDRRAGRARRKLAVPSPAPRRTSTSCSASARRPERVGTSPSRRSGPGRSLLALVSATVRDVAVARALCSARGPSWRRPWRLAARPSVLVASDRGSHACAITRGSRDWTALPSPAAARCARHVTGIGTVQALAVDHSVLTVYAAARTPGASVQRLDRAHRVRVVELR